jgi:hypothetical protein
MVYVTVALFAVAAVFGAINLVRLAASGRAPRVTVYLHGLVAATALVLLVIYAVTNTAAAPIVALILFVVAALGGFLLFGIDVTTKKPPKWLGFIHGAVAVAGFVFLLIFAFAGKGG